MIKKRRVIMISFIVLLLAVSSSLYASATEKNLVTNEQKEIIENAYSELIGQTNSISRNNDVIVAGEIEISKSEFEFYKANIKIINQLNATLNNVSNKAITIPSDQQLIDEMLKNRLSVQYAKNSGITVTEDEVKEVVNREKSMLYNEDLDLQNQALIKEIMRQRINLTGLSEEEFWNSDLAFNEYEKVLYKDKLYKNLISEKEISDIQDFEKFQNNLLEQYKNVYDTNLD